MYSNNSIVPSFIVNNFLDRIISRAKRHPTFFDLFTFSACLCIHVRYWKHMKSDKNHNISHMYTVISSHLCHNISCKWSSWVKMTQFIIASRYDKLCMSLWNYNFWSQKCVHWSQLKPTDAFTAWIYVPMY